MTSKLCFNCEQEIMVFDDKGLTSPISSFMFNITVIRYKIFFELFFLEEILYAIKYSINVCMVIFQFLLHFLIFFFFFITALSE